MSDNVIDWYDCSGKPDGNYVHPSDPTKFITCVAEKIAYERSCPPGTRYDPDTDTCIPM
ncbi:carbohydrate-binding module family 14 protein [Nocardia arthritidis]